MVVKLPIWSEYKGALPADRAILDYAGAREAFGTLTAARVNGEEMLNQLQAIVLLARLPLFKKGDWAEGSGKTRRTIRLFPARVRSLADEIERVNAHSLLLPGLYSDESGKQLYEKLPDILRAYSCRLEGHISVVGRLNAELSRARAFQDKLLLYLSHWVQSITGKFFDDEVSLLVTATYSADGQEREVSAQALKVLHSPKRSTFDLPRIVAIQLFPAKQIIQIEVEVEA